MQKLIQKNMKLYYSNEIDFKKIFVQHTKETIK